MQSNNNNKIFEIRKIQITGGSTYLVSLPKKWVKKIGLEPGAQVALFESEIYKGKLIIDPQYTEVEKIKEVDIEIKEDKGFDLRRELLAAYLFGYDLMNIKSSIDKNISLNQREEIKNMIQKLIGIEIVEESSKIIKVQCLISTVALPLKKTIERIFLIVFQMLQDAIQSIITDDIKLAHNVIDRDEEVNRLYFLCVRQLRSSIQDANIARLSKITPLQCLDYRVIAKAIENAGDHIVEIIKIYLSVVVDKKLKLPTNIKNKIFEITSKVLDMLNKSNQVMSTRSMELAIEVIGNDKAELKTKADDLRRFINTPTFSNWTLSIDSILDLIIKISDVAGVDIADLVMS